MIERVAVVERDLVERGDVEGGVIERRVVVIGAGQAGLAAAHGLVRRGFTPGLDLEVLDANPTPGGAWSHRWDALTFDDAHGIHDLPGMPLGEVDPREPAREIVKRYYGAYEEKFELSVRRPVRVTAVERREGGGFLVHVTASTTPLTFSTDTVISATGTWDSPFVPWNPGRFDGVQLTTRDFRAPEDFHDMRVLVVGGGASAVQFILLLEEHGVDTLWSTRGEPRWTDASVDPEWGRDVERRVREKTHRGLPSGSVVSNTGLPLLPRYRAGIERGRLVSRGPIGRLHADGVTFADGSRERVDAILWATGFRPSLDHPAPLRLREPGGGLLIGKDDVTVVREPGLFVVGYGSSASTVGATRAGRAAARAVNRVVAPSAAVPA